MENQSKFNAAKVARQMAQIHQLQNSGAELTPDQSKKLAYLQEETMYAMKENEEALIATGHFALIGKAKTKVLNLTEEGLKFGLAEITRQRENNNRPTQKSDNRKSGGLNFIKLADELSPSAKLQLAAILLTDIFCTDIKLGVNEGDISRFQKVMLYVAQNRNEVLTGKIKEGDKFVPQYELTTKLFGATFEPVDLVEALSDAAEFIDEEYQTAYFEDVEAVDSVIAEA